MTIPEKAIQAASAALAECGYDFPMPVDGDLDDEERGRYETLTAAAPFMAPAVAGSRYDDLRRRAKAIADEANECCNRDDGYAEEIEDLALQHLAAAAGELRATLRLFREFVNLNATQWRIGSSHHHPMWMRVATALGDENGKVMTRRNISKCIPAPQKRRSLPNNAR